jgi:hypothetical protein
MALLTVAAPTLTLHAPDNWRVTSTAEAHAVAFGESVDDFITNIVAQQDRVASDLSIEQLADAVLADFKDRYEHVDVRESRISTGSVDRIVSFSIQGRNLIQYQRLLLAEGSLGSHWLVHVEATCAASYEEAVRPIFVSALNTLHVESVHES